MLSRETETKLAEVFLRLSSSEQQVESSRLSLSSSLDFDVYSTFRALDRLGLGSISSSDLLYYLDKHHYYATSDEVYLTIKQYDSDQNGRLSLDEFHNFVLPSTDPSLKSLGQTRRGYFSPEVEYLFIRLLQSEINLHRSAETARKSLSLRFDYSPLECFKAVDSRGLSYIDRVTLLDFLRRFRFVSEEDVDSVFRRVDNDGDNLLTYKEFTDSIVPLQGNAVSYRFSSPARTETSFRRTSPLRNSSGFRENLARTGFVGSYLSPRRTSPLRNSSPLRESQSSSFLRKSLEPLEVAPLGLIHLTPLQGRLGTPHLEGLHL
jgi:Ca2+-binding EF-hand superfamily protein